MTHQLSDPVSEGLRSEPPGRGTVDFVSVLPGDGHRHVPASSHQYFG